MRSILSDHLSGLFGLPAAWLVCLAMLFAVAPCLPGCGGCRPDQKTEAEKEAERLAKEREEKKPDFEIAAPVSQPCGPKDLGCRYKPGHWTSTVIRAKANKDDFDGQLELSLFHSRERSTPVGLDAVPYSLDDRRDVALIKGREKNWLASFYAPANVERMSGRFELKPRRGYRRYESPFPMTRMFAYQYHLAVLARAPDRYAYLRTLPSVKPPTTDPTSPMGDYHYWVSLLKVDRQTTLPAHALFWTSTAYVIWDDVDPKSLSLDQQRALVDWLHWGGQLIFSGPDTLDSLRDSFLADYLPASAGDTWKLDPADFAEVNRNFTLPGQRPLTPLGEWSGINLRLADDAQYVPGTGKLLAERRVGLGRTVASAVRLSDRSLIAWHGFDNFFNACLLRRPGRTYSVNAYDEPSLQWTDPKLGPQDAALTCKLRYFSRDAGVGPSLYTRRLEASPTSDPTANAGISGVFNPSPTTSYTEPPEPDGTGVAAWRSFSPVANSARGALQNAACVEVPGRWFVIWVVAVYLAVLVPLNWFIFSALGRVEWAWAAAPLIAIGCTLTVVHLARLDIGFARSETSLGVIEIQGDYPRAHVTRYTALYTSLTTQYEFADEDAGALVRPFPTVARYQDYHPLPGTTISPLECRRGKDVRLLGFSVPSNFVDFVHAEQMVQLDGALETLRDSGGGLQLLNQTGLPVHGAGVIRKDENGRIETAWVGELEALRSASLKFVPRTETEGPWWPEQRQAEPATRKNGQKGEVNLRELTDLAEKVDDLRPGESRLVGWTDAPVGSFQVKPGAPQARHAYLVLVHLRYAPYAAPEPDKNTRQQVMPKAEKPAIEGP